MGRKEGSKNVREKTEAKYRMVVRNPIEDSESSKEFATVGQIVGYMRGKGYEMTESGIRNYILGLRKSPELIKFERIAQPCEYIKQG
jgi:hypothetical protein